MGCEASCTVGEYRHGVRPLYASAGVSEGDSHLTNSHERRSPSLELRRPGSRNIGVLISGRGTNLQALIDAIAERRLDARIAAVISNRDGVPGLECAATACIETLVIDHRGFASRDDFDAALAQELRQRNVVLVCLAGFMRLVGPRLLEAFPQAILNIHPSLLPAFPGVDAQRQALEHGVKITGASVHLVTGELDGGPIVVQAAVPVRDDDTVETLSARILVEEHRIYPEAVRTILDGSWRLEGRRIVSRNPSTPRTQ
jgi:phosphoribosylglycinamide formyltransferase 1